MLAIPVLIKTLLYLKGHPGVSSLVTPEREIVNIKRNEQLRYFQPKSLIYAVEQLETMVMPYCSEYFKCSPHDFRELAKQFIRTLKRMSLNESSSCEYLVSNNDPPGYACASYDFHDASSYTLVFRDYRDAFSDLVRLGKAKSCKEDLDTFVKSHNWKLRKFTDEFEMLDDQTKNQLILIHFENFVTSSKLRTSWLDRISITSTNEKNLYSAEKSQKNIGIYKDYLADDLDLSNLDQLNIDKNVMLLKVKESYPACFL